jgi:transposase-like protein
MTISFARHQFPPVIIRHAVWLYVRFALSYRDVEDLLAERGIDVSYETVRRWVLKFGPLFARELHRRRPRPTSQWHLDEMTVMIAGRQFWLWRAIDDEGEVLDLLVQRRRNKAAAVKLLRKLLKKQRFAPEALVTDKAALLRRGKVRNRIVGSPRGGLAQEQSGREYCSCDTRLGGIGALCPANSWRALSRSASLGEVRLEEMGR